MTSQLCDTMSSLNFFEVVLFLLSSLVTISLLVLELWRFPFITDWPEIKKSEIPSSEFYPIGDWEEFENQIWHVYNKMLLNAAKYQGYSFYRFWVLKGEPKGGGGIKLPPFPTQIRVKSQLFIVLITICSYFAPN